MLQVKYPNQIHLIRGNHEAGCARFEGVGPGTNTKKSDFRSSQGLSIWKMNEVERRNDETIERFCWLNICENEGGVNPEPLVTPLNQAYDFFPGRSLWIFASRRIQQSMPSTDSVMNADAASTRPGQVGYHSYATYKIHQFLVKISFMIFMDISYISELRDHIIISITESVSFSADSATAPCKEPEDPESCWNKFNRATWCCETFRNQSKIVECCESFPCDFVSQIFTPPLQCCFDAHRLTHTAVRPLNISQWEQWLRTRSCVSMVVRSKGTVLVHGVNLIHVT